MRKRVLYQGIGVFIVALILLLAGAAANEPLVKLNKIYTRTGDAGQRRAGRRQPGQQGVGADGTRSARWTRPTARSASPSPNWTATAKAALGRIQNELFDLGADLATPGEIGGCAAHRRAQVERLEAEIDAMNERLVAADQLHPARRQPRRVARCTSPARSRAGPSGGPSRWRRRNRSIRWRCAYFNRLSDHLFVTARHVAAASGGDVLWQPGATRT